MMNRVKYIIASSFFCVSLGCEHSYASAFTIDDVGNSEFSGNVKIGSKTAPVELKYNDLPVTSVPIGTVIDWWRPDHSFAIPKGFAICDGNPVRDQDSPYNGKKLPNLIGLFIRGVPLADIGSTGGSESIDLGKYYTQRDGEHFHAYSNYDDENNRDLTGKIANYGDDPGSSRYMIKSGDAYGWVSSSEQHRITVWRDGVTVNGEGHHRHELPGIASFGSSHVHCLSGDVPTIPPYYGLLKLIRYK